MPDMGEPVVLSGKGGTGKTSLAGALAAMGENQVLCDLARVAALAGHFLMPSSVLVQKADLHWPTARSIRKFCDLKSYHFPGFLPFTAAFTQAQVEGKTILEYDNNQIKSQLTELWEKLRKSVQPINPSRQ
jgi:MinD superfamily P-loop ATPase